MSDEPKKTPRKRKQKVEAAPEAKPAEIVPAEQPKKGMQITWELFRFPFDDPRWKQKFLIGGLLVMVGYLFFPVFWLIGGYGLEVMRRTARGEKPSLPEWSDIGKYLEDGVKAMVVGLVYLAPVWIIFCGAMVALLGSGVGAAILSEGGDEPASIIPMIAGQLIFYMAIGFAGLVGLPLGFLFLVARTRLAVQGTLRSAFELREIWALIKAGWTHYLLAMAVSYGLNYGLSMLTSILMYTIVLICVMPFAVVLVAFYATVLIDAMMGMAYHETAREAADAV